MTNLLKKAQKINITDKNFNILSVKPILQYPNFNKKFRLTINASDVAIGAILCQDDTDLPIAYASRTLSNAEQKYDATIKELHTSNRLGNQTLQTLIIQTVK